MFKYLKSADEIVKILSSENLEITVMKGAYEHNQTSEYRLPNWTEIQTYGLPIVYFDKKTLYRGFEVVENDFDAGKLTEVLRENMLKNKSWQKLYFSDLVDRSAKQTREKYKGFLDNEAE